MMMHLLSVNQALFADVESAMQSRRHKHLYVLQLMRVEFSFLT